MVSLIYHLFIAIFLALTLISLGLFVVYLFRKK